MYKTTHVLKPSSEIEFKGIYINFLITVMEIWNKSIYKQTCWFCEVLICLYKGNNSGVFLKNHELQLIHWNTATTVTYPKLLFHVLKVLLKAYPVKLVKYSVMVNSSISNFFYNGKTKMRAAPGRLFSEDKWLLLSIKVKTEDPDLKRRRFHLLL